MCIAGWVCHAAADGAYGAMQVGVGCVGDAQERAAGTRTSRRQWAKPIKGVLAVNASDVHAAHGSPMHQQYQRT